MFEIYSKFGLFPYGAVPNHRQMEWYRRGKTAFIHFTVNTFTGREWGDGTESPEIFNPAKLDCRRWIKVLKESGFTAAILTAKHHDGFCLWPSRYTEHSVKNSPYKNGNGDIVREFTDACKEFGIKAGLYLSPWDRNFPEWGTEKYNEYYANQLYELMTEYGDIYECWWDGAGSTEAVYDWQRWINIVRENQPNCVIFGSLGATSGVDVRWAGNELGKGGDPCFATIDPCSLETETTSELNSGKPDGKRFIPAECNTSIRPGWFYHPEQDALVKSPVELTRYWFNSVGKNGAILLNIPPNTDGLFCEKDCESLYKWNENIESIFKNNLLEGSDIKADEAIHNECGAQNLLKRDDDSFYAANVKTATVTFTLPEAVTFNCLKLEEVIELGHRVREFCVEAKVNGEWKNIITKECIGFCRAEHFDDVTADAVRIKITKAADTPVLRFFGIYKADSSVLTEDYSDDADKADLAKLPSAVIINNGDIIEVELGGIFPYSTVIFDAEGVSSFAIESFNGSQYEHRFYNVNGTSYEICKFERVEGSYKFRIRAEDGKFKEDVKLQVF